MPAGLSHLITLIQDTPEYRSIVSILEGGRSPAVSLINSAKPYVIAALYYGLNIPMLVITGQPETAKQLYEQLTVWCPPNHVRLFPEPEALPYERMASDNSIVIDRLQVLAALTGGEGTDRAHGRPMVVTSAPALMQKTLSRQEYMSACHTVNKGDVVKPFALLARWQSIGYRIEATTDVPGTISHRGGILDIFPPSSESPARLEFFGDTVESIRFFDPVTQRSLHEIASIAVTPATDLLSLSLLSLADLQAALRPLDLDKLDSEVREQYQREINALLNKEMFSTQQFYAPFFNRKSLLDFLPPDGLIVVDEPERVRDAVEEVVKEAAEIRDERVSRREVPANFPEPYLEWDELSGDISARRRIDFTAWGVDDDRQSLPFKPAQGYAGQLASFIQRVREISGQKKRVIVISHQASRLSELFEEQNIFAPVITEINDVPPPGSVTLVQGLLGEGWVLSGDTFLFTDAEIFGFTKQRRTLRRRFVPRHKLSIDIKPGDYVVHIEHGIARLAGVTTFHPGAATMREKNRGEREYLVLEYAAGDKLYVPADQIDRVTRYIGASDKPPALSRLGTQEWNNTRQRVNEAVEKVAKELLALYAAREVVPGFSFSRDTVWQQELEASFPYVETPDQLTVQREVKADMERAKPMDRLICGDVGYGKTEIAVRAAFKAVMDHKQVAVLVPTTVLAEQHYITFSQRFSAFPVRVEVLSRFRTHKEQQQILAGLADGTVDICIGTHRLIQKDVVFKDLGLLIIDEEQRFGVAHKEYLKKMRQEVDVLALSATPIPRTLHMSLVGVRDMSVMETPPEDRLPVKTYVAAYDDRLVREAIVRELERNGQVFFLHNRVQSINFIAAKLKELVPEARFAVAHGQMNEDSLEGVMMDFVQGKADVLVCTTIIESGLDLPNVNTLIVNHADRFGLTQLYQLRGRVGRGSNLAYAYFLYERGKHITGLAEKRLNTIFEATELGAGFGIAMKDLEIRGAGNLLGLRQSGHISAVGFNLYTQLLARAVDELKARRAGIPEEQIKATHLPPPTIDLPLPAYIPEDYIDDLNTRIGLYQKLVKTGKIEQIQALVQEFTDRFGKPPREVENLLYGVKIKILGTKAGIESIATDGGEVVVRRFEGMRFDRQKLEPYARGLRVPAGSLHIDPLFIRLDIKRTGATWQKILEELIRRVG